MPSVILNSELIQNQLTKNSVFISQQLQTIDSYSFLFAIK